MQSVDYSSSKSPRSQQVDSLRRQQVMAISVLLVLLAAGIGFGWWRWQSTRAPNEPLVDVPLDRGAWINMQRPPPPADGVRKVSNSYRLRSGDAVMYVAKGKDGTPQYSFSYQPNRAMTGTDAAILLARYNSQSLQLTREQIDRIEKLGPFSSGMVVSVPDRAKMASLWDVYVKADTATKPQAEEALKTALLEVANRSAEPTKAGIQERVAKIRQILTPEQTEKLTMPANRRGNSPAATRPSVP